MTRLVQPDDFSADGRQTREHWSAEQLELGNILFFAQTPFELAAADREFLLTQKQSGAGYHKNIAYRPQQDVLTGFSTSSRQDRERLHQVMRAYSESVTRLLTELLPTYATRWRMDFASFRPQQEQGRALRPRARNDLLHTDSFPTRPTFGDRILRVFTNVSPSQSRVWITGGTFDALAAQFARPGGAMAGWLPRKAPPSLVGRTSEILKGLARKGGLPIPQTSPYDRFMLQFHHFLKQNEDFQQDCPKQQWDFPPNSTWIVFTDMVAHAVLSGQFALEQTYIVAKDSLILPEKAPANVLDRLAESAHARQAS
jgi:hypothetical protein